MIGVMLAVSLAAGDQVWHVSQSVPEGRESVIVRRGLVVVALSGPGAPPPPDFKRAPRELSARERDLASARAARDKSRARDAVAEAPPLDWSLRADQALWVRFPGGLPTGLRFNDVVEAETSAGLTTDGSLDFLAVPPASRLWARVLASSEDGSARAVRLLFFKMRLDGGSFYPISGVATAVAGVPAAASARVGPDGAVSSAGAPAAGGKRAKDQILDEDARVRVRILAPVTIVEPPSWWRAGPGLWLKTAESGGRRRFEITHVVAGRSAAAAGLKLGDLLDGIDGRPAERMDFEEALGRLYGEPSSTVKVSVLREGGSTTVALTRGTAIGADGASSALPLPFEAR